MDGSRGWDHGVFVPMMLINPSADIPIVEMSILKNMDAKMHIEIGQALHPLTSQNILIIASGASFHNMSLMFGGGQKFNQEFDQWLNDVLTSKTYSDEERVEKMINWQSAPSALKCHPPGGLEHFLPLLVAFGAANGKIGISDQYSALNLTFSNFMWK